MTGHDAVAPAELQISLPLNSEKLLALYCVLLYDRHAPRCAQLEQFAKHFDALLPIKHHYPNAAELLAFTSPAKHLNFSRSARAHGLTPNAVSRQIASLEARFGVQLFFRDGRNLVLTRAGSVYLSRVGGPLRDIGNASLGIDERRRTGRLVDDCQRADLHGQVVDSAASGFPLQHAGSHDQLYPGDPLPLDLGAAIRYGDGNREGVVCDYIDGRHLVLVCSPDYHRRHPLRAPEHTANAPRLLHGQAEQVWVQWAAFYSVRGLHAPGARASSNTRCCFRPRKPAPDSPSSRHFSSRTTWPPER